MARVCDICAKGTTVGNRVQRRGITKKKGGIGLRITSRVKRKFKTNVQRIRVSTNDGKTNKRQWVCTRCVKAGKVTKARKSVSA